MSNPSISSVRRGGRPLTARLQPKPDLPAYPHHYAAPSVAGQVAYKRDHWGSTARALREEIVAAEEAMVAALDAQERQEANRARIRSVLAQNTDKGLR